MSLFCISREDNILQVWNKKAEGNIQKILNKIQTLVPNIELKSPFYKSELILLSSQPVYSNVEFLFCSLSWSLFQDVWNIRVLIESTLKKSTQVHNYWNSFDMFDIQIFVSWRLCFPKTLSGFVISKSLEILLLT